MFKVVHAAAPDIGAACIQSARIAREERFPTTADRMDRHAQDIRDGANLLILGGVVEYANDDVTVIKVTDTDHDSRVSTDYLVTITATPVSQRIWSQRDLRWTPTSRITK